MRDCPDCGTRLSDGTCPNCEEELFIYETQSEYAPEQGYSDDFMGLVIAQEITRANRK